RAVPDPVARSGLSPLSDSSGRQAAQLIGEPIEAAILEIVVETPALHLSHQLVELGARDRLVDEALAAAELAVVPLLVRELGRIAVPPERQVFGRVRDDRLLR